MKGIIYYTDNRLDDPLYSLVQHYIKNPDLPITSASLKPIDFGDNEVVKGERSYPTMIKQIISCLKRSKERYVFFCEHDVLYHGSHFDFIPERDDIFYYNENCWRWKVGAKSLIRHDRMISLSCLCANREFALDNYMKRLDLIQKMGWENDTGQPKWARVMGYEPGTKKRRRGGITDDDFETWYSDFPNIDIRHANTFSISKTKISDFKHKPKWWEEVSIQEVPGWSLEKYE